MSEFRASLPSRSRVLRFGVLALAALVLSRLLVALLPHYGSNARTGTATALDQLFDSTLGVLEQTAGSVGSAVDALSKASPAAIAAATLVFLASLYLIVRPVASTFRLKRLLLNLYPHAESMRSNTSASWSESRSTGIYSLEQETFAAFGARCPGEPPLDLLVALPVPVLWLGLCASSVSLDAHLDLLPLWYLLVTVGATLYFYCGLAAIRLGWLAAAWRARRGGPRSVLLLADEVRVPWRAGPVRCRSPVLIGWLSFLYPALYLIMWWPWWSSARDLQEFGRAHNVEHLRDIRPAAQAFAVGFGFFSFGIAPLIMLLRAPRFVREAQSAIGLERPVNHHVAWLAPLWPVFCLLLQRELNRLWHAEGTPIGRHDPRIDLARTTAAAGSISLKAFLPARQACLNTPEPVAGSDGERGQPVAGTDGERVESGLPPDGPSSPIGPGPVEEPGDQVEAL